MARARQDAEGASRYAVGIGSNRPLARGLGPAAIVRLAIERLDGGDLRLLAASPIMRSRPIGPSARDYANAAALVESPLPPEALLGRLQAIEHAFGRRRARRWGARTLDLDLLLWEGGGRLRSRRLTVPHPHLATRGFVLGPLRAIAPRWRVPPGALRIAHLAARLARAKPVDPAPPPR